MHGVLNPRAPWALRPRHVAAVAPVARAAWLGGMLLGAACAHAKLPGTKIPATAHNQAIYGVLEEIRGAFEARDPERLLALLSPRYFEDQGSPSAEDDYSYVELKQTLLREAMQRSRHSQLSMDLYEIEVRGDRAHADVRYAMRTQLALAEGERWETHRDFNRIELVQEDGRWKVLSGL